MKRTGLIALLLFVTACAWLVFAHLTFKSDFARIYHGDTAAQIIATLGAPREIEVCAKYGTTPPAGCVREFSYLSWPSFTDLWVIQFDKNDRVIAKDRLRSP